MLPRRKPVCHTCNNFMEGHKRVHGSPVCPTPKRHIVSPGTPLVSPPPSPTPRHAGDQNLPLTDERPSFRRESSVELCRTLKFDKLATGGYRRRNPNWESGTDIKQMPQQSPNRLFRQDSPAVSVVSTVLVGEEMYDSDDESIASVSSASSESTVQGRGVYPTPLGRQASFIGRLADYARFNRSLVTVFRAKKDELSTIHKGARRRGVHTATMPSPAGFPSSSPYFSPISCADDSTYVVLGKSKAFVNKVAERCHQPLLDGNSDNMMPGTLVQKPIMEGPRMITIPQLVILMTCTSCLVVFGLSLLS